MVFVLFLSQYIIQNKGLTYCEKDLKKKKKKGQMHEIIIRKKESMI